VNITLTVKLAEPFIERHLQQSSVSQAGKHCTISISSTEYKKSRGIVMLSCLLFVCHGFVFTLMHPKGALSLMGFKNQK